MPVLPRRERPLSWVSNHHRSVAASGLSGWGTSTRGARHLATDPSKGPAPLSQQATARQGVATVANVDVPSPVILTPYRSFSETEQVASPFVLRLRGGGDGKLPTCALFEADGGRWKLDAIKRVRDWVGGEVGTEIPVYG